MVAGLRGRIWGRDTRGNLGGGAQGTTRVAEGFRGSPEVNPKPTRWLGVCGGCSGLLPSFILQRRQVGPYYLIIVGGGANYSLFCLEGVLLGHKAPDGGNGAGG